MSNKPAFSTRGYEFTVGEKIGTFEVMGLNIPVTFKNRIEGYGHDRIRLYVQVKCDCGAVFNTDPGQLRYKMLNPEKGGTRCYGCKPVIKKTGVHIKPVLKKKSKEEQGKMDLTQMLEQVKKLKPLEQKWMTLRVKAYKKLSAKMRTPTASDYLLISELLDCIPIMTEADFKNDLKLYEDLGIEL